MQLFKRVGLLLSLFLITACTSQTTFVTATPELNINGSNIGQGQKIGVTVSDQRTNVDMKRDLNGAFPGAVKFGNDIVTNLAGNVNQMVARNGFIPVAYNNSNAKNLKVSLLLTEIASDSEDLTQQKATQVAVMVTARNHNQTYQHVYRSQDITKSVWNYYSPKDIQKNINQSFSHILNEMGNDNKLWQFLAKGK